MKNTIKHLLQRMLGFRRYLFLFSWYKVKTLRHDRKERDFFQFLELLPPDSAVLDIGANIGIMTVHLSRHLHSGEVVAFEPMPDNLAALRRIVAYFRLRNVRIFDCALGDSTGMAMMVMPVEQNARQQGLSHVLHESITERNEGIRVKVPVRRLDDIPDLCRLRLAGIKIDVENFEYFVLRGGESLLRRHGPVVYAELWNNQNRAQCFDLLGRLGYRINVVVDGALAAFDPSWHRNQNFVFTK